MATTKTKKTASNSKKVTNGKSGTTTVTSGMDELTELAIANASLASEVSARSESQLSFISLLGKQAKALDEDHPNYMPKAKPLDYAIVSKKLLLGKTIDATIVGMFKVYAEVTRKESTSDIPKTVSFWMPGDAEAYPVTEGYFDRGLPNGNILQPQHWVFLYLHDHPEIEDGVISFRSVGNTFYKQLQKLVAENATTPTELRFTVSNQKRRNEKYDKTDYYPLFELVGRNYTLKDGKVTKGDVDIDKDTLTEIIKRSNKLLSDYNQMKLISKKNIQSLPSSNQKAIPAYIEEDEDEDVAF